MKIISIGNDIVAFANTNAARTQQSKFYSKFLTNSEVDLYKNELPISFHQFIWLCWSIKESVYKFQQRIQPQLAFAWQKINIRQINNPFSRRSFNFETNVVEKNCLHKEECFSSITIIDNISFHSYSFIHEELIYTITVDEAKYHNIFWGIRKIEKTAYEFQSQSVREFISKKLIDVLGGMDIDILKAETGYPYIKQHRYVPVSFTHHHDLIGYAFLIERSAIIPEVIERSVAGY